MSNICTECFLDEYLKKQIRDEKEVGECSICGRGNENVIDTERLTYYFDPLVSLYTAQVEFLPVEMLKEREGRMIWEILTEDWEIFDNIEIAEKIIDEIYREGLGEDPLFLDNFVERYDEWHGTDTQISDGLEKQWQEFCEEITYVNRFFPQKKVNLDLMSEVLSYSEEVIDVDELLFRARLSIDGNIIPLEKMGAPPKDKAVGGRANPYLIPYLYLASDPNTAVSEIRPQVANVITVGTFKINKQIRIIDLRTKYLDTPFRWGDDLKFVLDIQHFLRMLGHILSKPVDGKKATKEYLPTQYLCEFIKSQKFDGVRYKSFLGEGYNTVLFDWANVECTATKLYRVTSNSVKFEEVVE